MKVNSVKTGVNVPSQQTNFRSQKPQHAIQSGHDEFVHAKTNSSNKTWWVVGGLTLAGIGAFLTHKAGWWGVAKKAAGGKLEDVIEFKNINEAKEYFEKLNIEMDLRGAKDEHLPLLNRIKENLKQLNEMGVKKDKPDSITISDWTNASEYEELCRSKGFSMERREGYWAFCGGAENGKSHVFINSKHPEFEKFLHEMGHASHFIGEDSYWHSKGLIGKDFANKQLEILNSTEKIYGDRRDSKLSNIFCNYVTKSPSKFVFPNTDAEVRFILAKGMIDKMYSETNCYDGGKYLTEQVADIFEGLMKGKKFSDETMLYYDFAGGARIPNLKIDGKTYDEYIESLYNNKELIQKLRENIKITKI